MIVGDVKLDNSASGETTFATITFSTINQLPTAGSAIVIDYPSVADFSDPLACSVKIGTITYSSLTSC